MEGRKNGQFDSISLDPMESDQIHWSPMASLLITICLLPRADADDPDRAEIFFKEAAKLSNPNR